MGDDIKFMQISNMVFPGRSKYGVNGLSECMTKSFKYKDKILKEYGPIFDIDIIEKYSSKIKRILYLIKNSKGIIFIYSQWINGSIIPLLLALEQNGYAKYSGNKFLNYLDY